MATTPELLVSGYTSDGVGPGIRRYALTADGTIDAVLAQSTDVANPSFLAPGPAALYAVEESDAGTLVALDPVTLAVRSRVSTGGADPCHVLVRPGAVLASNYSSGDVAVVPVAADGTLLPGAPGAPTLLAHPGSGPLRDRQASSHAHQATATPWGTVLVCDLGTDRIDEYAVTVEAGDAGEAGAVARGELLRSAELPPGTGPRHLVLRGSALLVAGELDGHLHLLRRDTDGVWHWRSRTPLAASAAEIPADTDFFPSHLALSEDAATLYAAVRGPDTLLTFDVSTLDAGAAPRFVAQVPSGGHWPRHFTLGHGRLYVAHQLSGDVAVFLLDPAGRPAVTPEQLIPFAGASCVLLR